MKERNCYVYEDYRTDNWSCCYVGMGSKNEENGYNRFEVAERNDHHDNIMKSCGIARVIIRDNLTRKEANALEEARIYYYVFVLGYTINIKGYRKGKKNDSHLTNQTWGGDGVKGCNPFANKTEEELEEWKKKLSEANKGEKNPMFGRTGEKAPFYGKHHSEETRKIISETRVEKGLSKGEKNPMYGRTGEKNPMYGRTGEKNPMYGKHHTEETRKRMSEKRQGEKNGRAKKVRCHTGEIFDCIKYACEWCGLKSHTSIVACCQGKQKSAGKHPVTNTPLHWEYVVEETIETNLNLSLISNINISI